MMKRLFFALLFCLMACGSDQKPPPGKPDNHPPAPAPCPAPKPPEPSISLQPIALFEVMPLKTKEHKLALYLTLPETQVSSAIFEVEPDITVALYWLLAKDSKGFYVTVGEIDEADDTKALLCRGLFGHCDAIVTVTDNAITHLSVKLGDGREFKFAKMQ
jgi:hypothetical protein